MSLLHPLDMNDAALAACMGYIEASESLTLEELTFSSLSATRATMTLSSVPPRVFSEVMVDIGVLTSQG